MFATSTNWDNVLNTHSSELMILVLFGLLMGTLIIIVPQLLRAHQKKRELVHAENMRALEQGMPLPPSDEATKAAGRTAMLVPIVTVICAATVTCFLVAFRSDVVFAVALTVWSVVGVVSLAAITGGVALIGRVAQLEADADEHLPDNPMVG